MGWSVHLPGCALCVTRVVHPGLWLNPTSNHFSRQTALSSVQGVSVTAPALRLGAGGHCLSGEKETLVSGETKLAAGGTRESRSERLEMGCLRPTFACVCVYVFAYQRVVHSSSCRVAASEAQMSMCLQLGKLGTQDNCWNSWVSEPSYCSNSPCRITFPSTEHSAWADRQRTEWGHFGVVCVFWRAIFSSSVALCGQLGIHVHMMDKCAVYAHVPLGDTSAPSSTDGWIWGYGDMTALFLSGCRI